MNYYTEPLLAFECNIPDGWEVLPDAWAKKAKFSAAPTSDKVEALLTANTDHPFLSLGMPQADGHYALPMIQCTAKQLGVVEFMGGPGGVVDIVLEQLAGAYPDFELLDREEPYLVAGSVGVYVKAGMSVLNQQGAKFRSISELLVLMAHRYCLIIGFSGPADAAHRPTGDFEAMLRSIRMS